jgi:hypothetical protein
MLGIPVCFLGAMALINTTFIGQSLKYGQHIWLHTGAGHRGR